MYIFMCIFLVFLPFGYLCVCVCNVSSLIQDGEEPMDTAAPNPMEPTPVKLPQTVEGIMHLLDDIEKESGWGLEGIDSLPFLAKIMDTLHSIIQTGRDDEVCVTNDLISNVLPCFVILFHLYFIESLNLLEYSFKYF